MTKGSDSKEFFELFKKPGGPESFQKKEEKPFVKPKKHLRHHLLQKSAKIKGRLLR